MERLAAWVMEFGGRHLEKELAATKQRWIAPLQGRVLELGPGLGATGFSEVRQIVWPMRGSSLLPHIVGRTQIVGRAEQSLR